MSVVYCVYLYITAVCYYYVPCYYLLLCKSAVCDWAGCFISCLLFYISLKVNFDQPGGRNVH